MTKKNAPVTIAHRLRAVRRRSREDLPDILDDLRETYTTFSEASDVVDSIDELQVDAENLIELLRKLGRESDADETELGAAAWNLWIESLEVPDVSSFTDAFDELETAVDSFESLVEADNYPGIGEERADAWNEVESAADTLAEAIDTLGIEDADETEEAALASV